MTILLELASTYATNLYLIGFYILYLDEWLLVRITIRIPASVPAT